MQVKVGIVGLEFGAEFIPIYQEHPEAEMYAICQRSEERLHQIGDRFGVARRYTSYADMLADPEIDAIHVNTPLHNHAEHVVAALEAGKHVACTIPMATSVDDCRRIVEAQRASGRTYMMMETVVYSREFLYLKQEFESGRMGRLQFLRASHQQDMTGWPDYWDGMPPMHNATHAISPTLALANHQARSVSCLGSGRVFERMTSLRGSPYSIETTHIRFKDSDVGAEVTRSLWAVAREYRESFDVFASLRSFEWAQVAAGAHVMYVGETPTRLEIPDFAHLLPAEIRTFTTRGVYGSQSGDDEHRSFTQGGGHGGSHPHLAHRFLMAVLDREAPYPDAVQAANITCAGILSHESALRGGMEIEMPEWTIKPDSKPVFVPLVDQGLTADVVTPAQERDAATA